MGKYKINGISTKKKNNLLFMLLVIFLISVILCISSFGIATWARYRSVTGSNVEAQIAKWSFKVNGEEERFADINLADTIAFEHVEKTTIAPGTYGSFDLDIDGRGSEVSLDYYINMEVAQKPTNMKFYLDSNYSQPIELAVGNKMFLEGDLLLSENPMQEIRTIYWKWDYRTATMPSEAVLNAYSSVIPGLETLINDYSSATGNSGQQQEIAMKINDKIDTQEAGGQVIVNVKVKGVQISPNFSLKRVQVTSSKDDVYEAGDTVNFSMEFTENVYGDNSKGSVTSSNAPEVTVGFGGTSANNPVAKVASLMQTNLKLSEGENVATFISASGNKINYSYTLKSGDSGVFRIASVTGKVYNRDGKEINFGTAQSVPEVVGGTVTTETPVVTPISNPTATPTGSVTPTPIATPISTALTSAQLGDYVDLGTDILDLQNVTLQDNSHPTTDWRVFNKDENGTWLMLADYLPKSKLPSGTGLITHPDSNYPYSIYAHTRSDFLNGINNVGWKNLLQNTSLENVDGVVVKGAIDIENWVESFNSNPEYTQLTVSDYGDERRVFGGYSDAERTTPYQMGTWTCYLDLNCASNTLYFPHIDNNSFYLLNSAYYVGDGNHKCVHVIVLDEISFGGADCNNNQWSQYERWGLRPVVYIPNTIQFTSLGSVWTLGN